MTDEYEAVWVSLTVTMNTWESGSIKSQKQDFAMAQGPKTRETVLGTETVYRRIKDLQIIIVDYL